MRDNVPLPHNNNTARQTNPLDSPFRLLHRQIVSESCLVGIAFGSGFEEGSIVAVEAVDMPDSITIALAQNLRRKEEVRRTKSCDWRKVDSRRGYGNAKQNVTYLWWVLLLWCVSSLWRAVIALRRTVVSALVRLIAVVILR